jgi:transcription elongation GreA/GreB family factor
MEALAHIPMGEDQFEEWFLSKVSGSGMSVNDMQNALRELRRAGMTDQTSNWAELMEDALIEQACLDDAVKVLRMRAEWNSGNAGFRDLCVRKLTSMFRNDPVRKKFVANIGLDRGIALAECFRRLETLQNLKPGLLCVDKTWGVGAIKKVDAFYERVTIDFSRKMGHEMSFAYAAETLQLVDDQHLLARKYRDAVALASLAETEAAELVRIALRSYGPLPVARLQEILSDGIIKPDGWKIFWEAARKALKNDPLVVIPAKRNEPIALLDKAKAYDATWFAQLASDRTAEGVFARLDELADNAKPDELEVSSIRIIGERLAFLMKGFGDKDMSIRVQVVVLARQWTVAVDHVNWEREAGMLIEPSTFMAAAQSITSKRLEVLLKLLVGYDSARLYETITESIPGMTMNVLNSCVGFMLDQGQDSACSAVFKELIGMRKAGVEVLFWLARRPDRLEAWGLGTTGDLAFQILPALEKTYNGERLRASNQLCELVQQREWLEAAAHSMNEVQRTSFIRYLYAAMGKVPVDTQAMIGRMVRVYPELAEILVSKRDQAAQASAPKMGLTSWRSYRQRQKLLEKIVNEDIPKNSRDIGVARSYGDLRENFEYKTAKEQQGILMRRSAELEQDLNAVRGTDFASCGTDVAGMGTSVTLQMADGHTEQHHILGEWDQDTEMKIISCSSRMGKVLAGHRIGDELMVPGDQGEVSCKIIEVSALPEAVIMWLKEG